MTTDRSEGVRQLRLLYVMGAGRSGSTLMDMILSQHELAVGVGELSNLPRAFSGKDEFCSCGSLVKECGFWEQVTDRWQAETGAQLRDLSVAQAVIERQRNAGNLFRSGQNSRKEDRYVPLLRSLYIAICAVSGRDIIVDSSKNPLRASALSRDEAFDLRVVHLVRDPRGVANSLKKALAKDPKSGVQKNLKARSLGRSAVFWNLVNLESEIVKKKLGPARCITVRYEDFVADILSVLDRIGRFAGIDLQEIGREILHGRSATATHMVAGNRLRMAGPVKVRPDQAWKEELSYWEQRFVAAITSPLRTRYGYPFGLHRG